MAEVRFVWNELAMRELLDSPAGPVAALLKAHGEKVAATARRIAPYDAGDSEHTHVRDGIEVQMNATLGHLEVDVISTAADSKGRPVGLFVEVGTSDTRAQPYLRPALDSIGGSNG